MPKPLPDELIEMIVNASGKLILACILDMQRRISSPLRLRLALACSPKDVRCLFHSGYIEDACVAIQAHIDQGDDGIVLSTLEGKVYGKPTDEQYTLAGILHQLMVWMILAPGLVVANNRLTMPRMRMLQNG